MTHKNDVFDHFKTRTDIDNFIFDYCINTGINPKEILLTPDCFERVRPWHVDKFAKTFTIMSGRGDTVIKMYESNISPKDNVDKNKCCSNPKIIQNQVFFETFYVCQNCKTETTKEGKPV
jgi:hypothetical protein